MIRRISIIKYSKYTILQGIDDENLRVVEISIPENRADIVSQIEEFKRNSMSNLSLCYLKTSQWKFCIAACNKILADCPLPATGSANGGSKSAETGNGNNKAWAKALYRRAKV